jgi:hypothetical protein
LPPGPPRTVGSWGAAADCYSRLLQLADAAPPEDPLRGRRAVFQRRFAEAAARGGQLADAEAVWRVLVDAAGEALAAAEAAGGEEQAVAAAEGELVDCLCRLAEVQVRAAGFCVCESNLQRSLWKCGEGAGRQQQAVGSRVRCVVLGFRF